MFEPRIREPGYYSAAICRRGHVETPQIELCRDGVPERCDTCGALILAACPNCRRPIRGAPTGVLGYPYTPPDFCRACASPFLWASDRAIVYHIENQLDEEPGLSEADRRALAKQLSALRDDQADAPRRAAALTFFKKTAPHVWDAVQPAVKVFLTTEVQAHLK
jgi:hypothetical protein